MALDTNALAAASAANVQGEQIAEVSQKGAMVAGAYVAAQGGPVGFLAFAAGVAGGMAGSQLAAAVHADAWVAKGLEAAGMHRIGVPGPAGYEVARLGDQVAHSYAVAGLLATIAVGAIAAVAVGALVVATGGMAAVALVGAAAAGGFAGGFLGSAIGGALGQMGARTGAIITGSPDVFAGGKPVARVTDTVACAKEPAPVVIIEGNPSVFANGLMLARIGHKLMCGAVIDQGCATVLTTEVTEAIAVPNPEVPVWLRVVADWASFLPLGAAAARLAGKTPTSSSAATRGGNPCKSRTCKTDPVDVATGEWIEQRCDIEIPGVLPFALHRTYASGAAQGRRASGRLGLFGIGWHDSASLHLTAEGDDQLILWDEQGCGWVFHTPHPDLNAAHSGRPDWRLEGTRERPCLRERSGGLHRYFEWVSDAHGNPVFARLREVRDSWTNRLQFDYSGPTADARLTAIRHSAGWRLDCVWEIAQSLDDYDRDGVQQLRMLFADVGMPVVELVRWLFDRDHRLIRCRSEFSGQTYYRYDGAHRAVAWGDASHTHVQLEYDVAGRVCQVQTPGGIHAGQLVYDSDARLTRVIQAGAEWVYHYNEHDLVTAVIDPAGRENHIEWDACKRKVGETDPGGRTTRYAYSRDGALVAMTDPDGLCTAWEYDDDGRLVRHSAPDGRVWQWEYDGRGALLQADSPTGSEQFRYRQDGCLVQYRDGGRIYRYEWDHAQRPCAMIDPRGAVLRHAAHRLGRIHTVTDAAGRETRYEFAAPGVPYAGRYRRPVAVHHPDGTHQTVEYDREGLPCAHTDAAGARSVTVYGPYDLPSAHTDPGGFTHHYRYDHEARLCEVRNPLGLVWRREYDAAGLLVHESDFAGRSTRFQYDEAGRLRVATLPDGEICTWHYDERGRLTFRQSGDCVLGYEWDAFNRATRATVTRAGKLESDLVWHYDAAGRVVQTGHNGANVARVYDPAGDCIGRISPLETVQYSLDARGLLARLHAGAGGLMIERDARGAAAAVVPTGGMAAAAAAPGAAAPGAAAFRLLQQFDVMGRLSKQTLERAYSAATGLATSGAAPQHVALRTYRHSQGHLVGIDDGRFGLTEYGYDPRGQLAQSLFAGGGAPETVHQERFDYNPLGDILFSGRNSPAEPDRITSHAYRGGALQRAGALHYRHDARGRMVERIENRPGFRPRIDEFKWDGFDRLIEVHTLGGSLWRYRYDAFGRRIAKVCVRNARGDSQYNLAYGREKADERLVAEEWLWDGAVPAQQTKIYADGSRESLGWHFEPDSFTPLALTHCNRAGIKQWLLVVPDHLGTPRELLNTQGEVVWAAQTTTWGGLRREYRSEAANDARLPEINLRFPGQWYDAETGLHYNYQRYYDPASTQYCSPDPIGLAGGMRPHGYVHDPVEWMDPLGLSGCVEATAKLAEKIPAKFKQNFKCKEFAARLQSSMKENNINGELLKVKSTTGFIWSEKKNMSISTNGDHHAILVKDTVFDNHYDKGIPLAQWNADLGIGHPVYGKSLFVTSEKF